MKKERRKLKNWVCFLLLTINTWLVMLFFMLIVELNTCYLFYSISINIIILNTYIIHKYGSSRFNREYMNLFDREI